MGGRASEALKAPGPEAAWKWNGNGRQTATCQWDNNRTMTAFCRGTFTNFESRILKGPNAEQQTSLAVMGCMNRACVSRSLAQAFTQPLQGKLYSVRILGAAESGSPSSKIHSASSNGSSYARRAGGRGDGISREKRLLLAHFKLPRAPSRRSRSPPRARSSLGCGAGIVIVTAMRRERKDGGRGEKVGSRGGKLTPFSSPLLPPNDRSQRF